MFHVEPLGTELLDTLPYFQYLLGFYNRYMKKMSYFFIYYILKLLLNTDNDAKNMYLDLDPENLCKIQGSAAEPQ